ncbi:MAG TPA: Mg2+ and Co2+ transporter CorB [Clostridiaceae bacterium]|nr:Mg2+ and Co2+ transporter CorB [Clostridiaceae bacterium]
MDDGFKYPSDEKKAKFRINFSDGTKENSRWIINVSIVSFLLSATLLILSNKILEDKSIITGISVLIFIIFIGVLFDIIGISVTAAEETPFHAMASRKYYGAKKAIKLIRNANKVSSICNDIVGDICGILSGAASALVVMRISEGMNALQSAIVGFLISGMVAASTIGGKALGKTFAINNSNYIVYKVSVLLQFVNSRFSLGNNKKKRKNKCI